MVSTQLIGHSDIGGTLTYDATGLPPGLSLNSSTGLITGTISAAAVESTYRAQVRVIRDGTLAVVNDMVWSISSGIEIIIPETLYDAGLEGTSPPTDPLTATNLFNRPVTFSAANLPPGITLNSTTGRFEGTYAAGSHGYYETTFQATDGTETASVDFEWYVTGVGIISPGAQLSRLGDAVDLQLN